MDYPVFHRGAEVGRLTAVSDGLYWQLTAWCSPFADGVQRLYGSEGLNSEPYGVFSPGGREFSLHRRLSKHACPKLPELWITGRECEGFRPWQGTVEGQRITDAMLRAEPEGMSLAIPTDLEPIPLAEYMPQMTPVTLNGREYLTLMLRDGLPVIPEV